MESNGYSGTGIMGMADLMDAAQAAVHPESAQLHGLIEPSSDPQPDTPALAAARNDGFTPVLLLGRGSSGEVWRCVDEGLSREVAAKIVTDSDDKSAQSSQTILRAEADILGKLDHPGIVDVIKHVDQGQASYLAMQFIDGDDLFAHCQILDLDLDQRLALFRHVLDIVVHLHGKGVVHGDLKPDHILIREGGHPVLIDFGLASRWHSAEQVAASSLRVGGSGPYRSPEVVAGRAHRPDPKQDVYALGVILRRLIQDSADGADTAILDLCDCATADDPDQRLPDAAALMKAFNEGLADQDRRKAKTTPRRLPVALMAVAIVACLVILVSLMSAWLPLTGKPDRDASDADRFSSAQQARDPVLLPQRSRLLEGALLDVQHDRLDAAGEQLQPILAQQSDEPAPWEVRHLRSRIEGRGFAEPFTDDPYWARFALTTAYDPSSSTLSYVLHADRDYEVWTRREGADPRLVMRSPRFVHAVAVAPGAKQIAGIFSGESVAVWTVGEDPLAKADEWVLPRHGKVTKLWFAPDGDHLYVFSPAARQVECWAVGGEPGAAPVWSIDNCDQAYTLPSGQGQFIVATSQGHDQTMLRLIGEHGEVTAQLELEDDKLPVSVDTLPDAKGLVCLGMVNGYVRIYDPQNGWLIPRDLGVYQAVTSILYCPQESRIYAGMGRVHVLDTEGQLQVRLGDREAPSELIASLRYSPHNSSVTCVTHRKVWRWLCPPAMN